MDKPKTGCLKYGGRAIMIDKPFRELQAEKQRLVKLGYDKKMFLITYYYGSSNR